jgi:hypothetical protein
MSKFLLFFAVNVQNMPLDSYSGNVDNEIKLLRNIRIFNLLSQVFLSKTGIAGNDVSSPGAGQIQGIR